MSKGKLWIGIAASLLLSATVSAEETEYNPWLEVPVIPDAVKEFRIENRLEDPDASKPQLVAIDHDSSWYDEDDYDRGMYLYWQEVALSDTSRAAYPQLSEGLARAAEEERLANEEWRQETLADLQYGKENDNPPYRASNENSVMIRRADAQAVSYIEDHFQYTGGAHGYYCYLGNNFNTMTGEQISVSDVITDPEMLKTVLMDLVKEYYPDLPDAASEIDRYAAFTDNDLDLLQWVLEPDGITVIFNPYEIAAYASGMQTLFIPFAKYPELFTGAYTEETDGYIRYLSDYQQEYLYDPAAGEVRTLTLQANASEEDYYVDSYTINYGNASVDLDQYAFEMRPYQVCTDDHRHYLYLDLLSENDYHIIEVVDLDNMDCVGTISAAPGAEVEMDREETAFSLITDPNWFALNTRIYMLSTYSGKRCYRTGADGMPEALTDGADLAYRANPYYPLKTTRELPVTKTDLTGTPGEQASIPAGSSLYIWRTDGENYVDLLTDKAELVRVSIDTSDGWPNLIGGEPEDSYFEMLFYAG